MSKSVYVVEGIDLDPDLGNLNLCRIPKYQFVSFRQALLWLQQHSSIWYEYNEECEALRNYLETNYPDLWQEAKAVLDNYELPDSPPKDDLITYILIEKLYYQMIEELNPPYLKNV